MYRLDDDQYWIYPHPHPHHPHHPHLGPNFVVSPIGRGPKGPKGDALKYSDMTETEKADLAGRASYANVVADYEETVVTLDYEHEGQGSSRTYTTINSGLTNYHDGAVLSIEINGLDLPPENFSISGSDVTFDPPLIKEVPYDTEHPLTDVVRFRCLSFASSQEQAETQESEESQES